MDAVLEDIGPFMPLAASSLGPSAKSTIIATENSNTVVLSSSFWDVLRGSWEGRKGKRRVGVGLLVSHGNSLISMDGSNR